MAPLYGSTASKVLLFNPATLPRPFGRVPPDFVPGRGSRAFRGASLRCYAAAAVVEQHRIKVHNPIVEMDGVCHLRS
ncbi:hypothetical protein GUJ93_ZPchr0004g39144 [Zizania palustris]|uniref:Uncharacterized protein n=1 Tax=Zizania palustris TaxID=103762 RepID=A0A8J5SC63_ZIZPA|nr:hypothetical protein GUJ93_ZPchr0004g39144 [Zizania palustris]